jgi:5'-nucleotidase
VGPGQDKVLQVSNGFSYTYDRTAPRGRRVDPSSITIAGHTLVASQIYRVATNDFLVTGGDAFTVLTETKDRITGEIDLDTLTAYFAKHSPLTPGPLNRILRAK